jgi:hypothetical protein
MFKTTTQRKGAASVKYLFFQKSILQLSSGRAIFQFYRKQGEVSNNNNNNNNNNNTGFILYSRPTLGPTWPSILWVPGALSSWVLRLCSELNHKPLYSAEVKNEWKRSVVHLLSRRLRFYLKAVLFGFVMDTVELGEVLLAVLPISPSQCLSTNATYPIINS